MCFNRIDKNGDSEGNFTAFALKEFNYTFVSKERPNKKFQRKTGAEKSGNFLPAPGLIFFQASPAPGIFF